MVEVKGDVGGIGVEELLVDVGFGGCGVDGDDVVVEIFYLVLGVECVCGYKCGE